MPTATKKAAPARKPLDKLVPGAEEATKEAVMHPTVTLAQVPPTKFYDEYISRTIQGKTEFDIFDFALTNKLNVLIEGPTGPGKTSAALAYSAKNQLRFYAIPSNVGLEPSQMFGKFIPDQMTGGFRWADGPVTDIIRNGGVLLINEVNFMLERVATVLFGLLDKRRQIMLVDNEGEVISAHGPNCWCDLDAKECREKWVLVMADMNPDYAGTRPLNVAFRNRFAIQLHWDYDPVVEAQLVTSKALLEMAKSIRGMSEFDTPVATNMMQEFERLYFGLGIDFAIDNFINHFPSEDRTAVKNIVVPYSQNIAKELDSFKQNYWPDEEKKWKPGDIDPIMGIYDEEWAFEEEATTA